MTILKIPPMPPLIKGGIGVVITSCFQKLIYKFLKAYLVLCPVNQPGMC